MAVTAAKTNAGSRELKDLVVKTLETTGVLGQIRAQLRANVYKALDTEGAEQAEAKLPSTVAGQLMVEIVADFMEFFGFKHTLSVFGPESGFKFGGKSRGDVAASAGLSKPNPDMCILEQLLLRPEKGRPSKLEVPSRGTRQAEVPVAPSQPALARRPPREPYQPPLRTSTSASRFASPLEETSLEETSLSRDSLSEDIAAFQQLDRQMSRIASLRTEQSVAALPSPSFGQPEETRGFAPGAQAEHSVNASPGPGRREAAPLDTPPPERGTFHSHEHTHASSVELEPSREAFLPESPSESDADSRPRSPTQLLSARSGSVAEPSLHGQQQPPANSRVVDQSQTQDELDSVHEDFSIEADPWGDASASDGF